MSRKVYVIILNWNNGRDTVACLESVSGSTYGNFQVVVVDNGSDDGSESRIRQWAGDRSIAHIRYDRRTAERGGDPREEEKFSAPLTTSMSYPLVLIQTGENLGYAGGNNVGLRYALARGDCRYAWLLNNDTVVDGRALEEMVALAEKDARTGMVGSRLLHHDAPGVLQMAGGGRITAWAGNASMVAGGMKDDGRWDRALELDYVTGASLLVRREVLEEVGLMDERYFLYWEDADWGARARRKGYRLLYCPGSRVWHREGGTVGRLSPRADYYWTRNGLMFTRRFHPWFLPLVMLSYLAKYTLVRTLRRQPYNFMSFASGLGDFLRGRTGRIS